MGDSVKIKEAKVREEKALLNFFDSCSDTMPMTGHLFLRMLRKLSLPELVRLRELFMRLDTKARNAERSWDANDTAYDHRDQDVLED